jgi:regulatory protein
MDVVTSTENQYRKALDLAGKALSAHARTEAELRRMLTKNGFDLYTVERVIHKLSDLGYIDDKDFASQWVSIRSDKYIGKQRLAQELHRKGVCKEHVSEVLDTLDDEAYQRKADDLARRLSIKYAGHEPDKVIRKTLSALYRRGFSWEEAKAAVQNAAEPI